MTASSFSCFFSSPGTDDHVFAEREESQLSEKELSKNAFLLSVNKKKLVTLLERVVEVTEGYCVEQLQTLHSTFHQLVFHHQMSWDRAPLLQVIHVLAHHIFRFTSLFVCKLEKELHFYCVTQDSPFSNAVLP